MELQAASLESHYPFEQCSELVCFSQFLDEDLSQALCDQLIASQEWPDTRYRVYERTLCLPRQQTWHADEKVVYSYTNNLLPTRPWTPLLLHIRDLIALNLGVTFNAVLMNHYRNGIDYVGWHSDDDVEMGEHPLILSLSLGAERCFSIRHNATSAIYQMSLPSGSLLLMKPGFQKNWQHAVLSDAKVKKPRINLTFRNVIPP